MESNTEREQRSCAKLMSLGHSKKGKLYSVQSVRIPTFAGMTEKWLRDRGKGARKMGGSCCWSEGMCLSIAWNKQKNRPEPVFRMMVT